MTDYRSLTIDEIETLERQGCTADDWTRIDVAEEFVPSYLRNVAFHGDVRLGLFDKQIEVSEGYMSHTGISNATLCDVTIGDNCLISNIGCHICRYDIGEECYIANIGTMATTEGASFGQGGAIAVMNEAGDGNVIVYDRLTAQLAALMVDSDGGTMRRLKALIEKDIKANLPVRGIIGYRVKIVNTKEIVNTIVDDDCEINGASRLFDCTLKSNAEASTFVGTDVVCDNTMVMSGATLADGAKLDNCFVGEACHIGRGFSAESSVFFANSYMDNGEACASFCGPFTVSHHKSTLLIGGRYSFYNAGSNTNFSNHAYKLGPIHYGTLERGCKTASGAHLLWPAKIGAFSVCIGKIENHPDTRALPFSYVIGCNGQTTIVPGRNLTTVGTHRDTAKWPRRDMRPRTERHDIVNFDWLSPTVMGEVLEGIKTLDAIVKEQGEDATTYIYNGCTIKASSLHKGRILYELVVSLYMGKAVEGQYGELPESTVGTGTWTDLAGLIVPLSEVERLTADISEGRIESMEQVELRLTTLNNNYEAYKWNWTYKMLTSYLGIDSLTEAELADITDNYKQATKQWNNAVRHDAEREYALGDVDEATLTEFVEKLER